VAATVTCLIYVGSFEVNPGFSGARIFPENDKNTSVIFGPVKGRSQRSFLKNFEHGNR
jgi:hypothetical protein